MTLTRKPRVIYTVHGFHIIHRTGITRTIALLLEKISNHWVNLVVSTTEADRVATVGWHTAPAEKTRAIHNGIDPTPFQEAQGETTRTALKLGNDPVVVIVARLHPQKDIGTALVSWKTVHAALPQAHLLVVGDGPLRKELEDRIKTLGINESARLLGHRTDTPSIVAAANIVVLPTHWEGMALAPLEAGAAHKPIIATDIAGMNETVVQGVTGVLVPEYDAEALAEAILDLLNNPEKSTRMGAASYERVVATFSLSAMAQAYRDAYATPAKN
jgi:glycosyltransferase involved in cell wall biosynthesis